MVPNRFALRTTPRIAVVSRFISPSFLGMRRVEGPALYHQIGVAAHDWWSRSVAVGRHHVKPLRGSYASLRPCG